MKKKILSVLLIILIVTCLFSISAHAASYYQTSKADVPIRSQPSKSAQKCRVISNANTVLVVVGSTTNSSGNLWYQLSDGSWVYSGNVKAHSHSYVGGICSNSTCNYEYPYSVTSYYATVEVTNTSGGKIWSRPYSSNSVHYRTDGYTKILNVVAKTTNQEGNTWYKLSDGCWVYSGNVKTHAHSYVGGICSNSYCRYEYSYAVTNYSATVEVANTDGAKIWSRPYSSNSVHYRTEAYKKILNVVAKTKNQEGNTWYKLSDGCWVYSDNVKIHTHSYVGGICSNSTCKYEYPCTVTNYSATVEVANTKGSKIWSRPYSSNSVHYRTEAYKKVLNVVAKTKNQEGNTWYKLTDGSWVYADNVKKHTHSYVGGICSNSTCKYEYPCTVTNYSATRYVINSSGAKIWSRPYSSNSTHVRTAAYGEAVTIVSKITNQEGNVWYKLSDGRWVYSKNVGKGYTITYNANKGKNAPKSQTVLQGAKLTLSSAKPTRVGYTFSGWATSSGASSVTHKAGSKYTFSSNTTLYAVWKKCSHTYKGGICTKCKYEYPLTETKYTGTFVVTNDNGAAGWSRPYSSNSKKVKIYDKDEKLKVVAKVTNINSKGKSGNLWYKLEDGNWVYSGNLTQRYSVKYDANGGKNAPAAQYFLSGKSVTITKSKPSKVGYIFKGWASSSDSKKVSHKAGSSYSKEKNLTLYAIWEACSHSYNSSGTCKTCKYTYKIKLDTSCSGTYVVTGSDGAAIRNTPYSVSGSYVRKAKKGAALTVVGKATNAHKNVWYKLDTGEWVYSARLSFGYMVTYMANGGTGAPAAAGFVSGKLVVSSTLPQRDGYVFMGWATSSKATKATYQAGDTYSTKKNITLYAVWSKCTHDYKNNYGICKNCKGEYTLVVKSVDGIVYSVNNKNGTNTYERPYSKTSEKVKKLSNKSLVVVVGYATNANKEDWCKLKDGSWIKKSEIKKHDTYNTIDSIPYKYAAVMIGDTADGGLYRTETVSGVSYYNYFDGEKSFYLNKNAFTGTSENAKLAAANKELTDAVNQRTSLQKKVVYNERSTEKIKAVSYGCGYNNLETHNHIVWEISLLTVKAGISGSDGVYVRCQNNAKTITIEYCTDAKNIEHSWSHTSNIYPKFTVATTPYAEDGDAVGWFTDFELLGNGLKTENFAIEDFVDLFSCAVKGVASTGKFLLAPTPKGAFDALKDNWKFYSSVDSYTKSTAYTSNGKNSLTYIDKKTSTAYRTYKMTVTSPINLRSAKDYLEAHIYLYELNKNQTISVKLEIT